MKHQTQTVVLALATLAVSSVALAADPTVSGITTQKTATGYEVGIVGENLSAPKVSLVRQNAYVLEFDALLDGGHQFLNVGVGGVKQVQLVWFQARPPKVHVVVRLDKGAVPDLISRDGQWIVTVKSGVATPQPLDPLTEAKIAPNGDGTLPPVPGFQGGPIGAAPATPSATVVQPAPTVEEPPSSPFSIVRAKQPATTPPVTATTPTTTPLTVTKPTVDTSVKPQASVARPAQNDAATAPAIPALQESAPLASKTSASQGRESVTVTSPEKVVAPPKLKATPKPEMPAIALGTTSVELNFVNTDVVQVLKALAIQTSQNIVVGANVSPTDKPKTITVTLRDVSLEEALNDVTAMANLRYAKVGRTYFVAAESDFPDMMRKVSSKSDLSLEYRVVQIKSGVADLIKSSTMKALPPDGINGFYEIITQADQKMVGILPGSDAGNASPSSQGEKPSKVNSGDNASDTKPAPASSDPTLHLSSDILVLVGEPQRLDVVEQYVKDIDRRLTEASQHDDIGSVVVPIQSGESKQILDSLERHLASNPRSGQFLLREASANDSAKASGQKVLSILGPKDFLPQLETLARDMDKGYAVAKGISYDADATGVDLKDIVIPLQYVEPIKMLAMLKDRFPNVRAWTLPDPVDPNLAGGTLSSSQSTTGGGGGGSSAGGGTGGDSGGLGGGNGSGVGGGSLGGGSGSSGGTSSSTSSTTQGITGHEPMRVLIQAPPPIARQVKEFIEMVDVEPPTIALEMRVLELSQEDSLRLGLDFSFLNAAGGTTFRVNQGSGDSVGSVGNINGNIGTPNGGSLNFLHTLDSLDDGRKIIARPNALISDGREADIFVGDTIRYIQSIQSTQNGVTATTATLQVGVKFDIKTRVSPSGQIALDLDQQFSLLTSFTPVPGGGELPQTSDRSSHLPINMQDGETVAIGGLITDQDRKTYGGIPFLKDLPIIGKLFGRTDNDRTRTEVVFFVTARLVHKGDRALAASPRTTFNQNPQPLEKYLATPDQGTGKKPH